MICSGSGSFASIQGGVHYVTKEELTQGNKFSLCPFKETSIYFSIFYKLTKKDVVSNQKHPNFLSDYQHNLVLLKYDILRSHSLTEASEIFFTASAYN